MEYIKKKHVIDATWFEPVYSDPLNVLTELRERLNELPTVDAVPVEWIKNFINRTNDTNAYAVAEMLSDWETENGQIREFR